MQEKIQDRTRGRWKDILRALGVGDKTLNGRHQECPFCGGGPKSDRFRFDDKGGNGTFFCNACGHGNGVDFVMRWLKCDFLPAKQEIEKHIGVARVVAPKAAISEDDQKARMARAWSQTLPLTGFDPASLYLARRGLVLDAWPKMLRWAPDVLYTADKGEKVRSYHPAMVAKFVGADGVSATLHRTFLDGKGRKANLPEVKKLAMGRVPAGGAVRLANSAETMGIAEGIETALAASLLHRVPVWAATTAGLLQKWQPPKTAKHVIIFADNDRSFAGQVAAFGLAYRLRTEGIDCDVRIPDEAGVDWLDVWQAEQGITEAAGSASGVVEGQSHGNEESSVEFQY